jgi:hypothetical protein
VHDHALLAAPPMSISCHPHFLRLVSRIVALSEDVHLDVPTIIARSTLN